jgi:hypothetical protein
MPLSFLDTNKDNTISLFEFAPLFQILAIVYLMYLVLLKKTYILLPFFILFGLQAFLDRQKYYEIWKTQEVNKYDLLWYKIDLVHIVVSVICIIFIFL